jgi:hypothetical protein
MSFEKDIQKARDHLAQAEDLYRRNKRSLFMIQKMCRKAEYKLLDLEQKAKEAAEEAKYVDFPPFVCAIQYESQYSYSKEPPKVETIYECRGKYVYVQGTTKPISKKVLAHNRYSYGTGCCTGEYHGKSIVGMVKKHFIDYFEGKTTETPKPLEFHSSYSGN